MALYLKYRPQTLDELIGQEAVKNTLLAALKSGKIAHAYIFVGSRGTGKTSTARILAKMVNCKKSGSPSSNIPCNKCSACTAITDGSSLDLIEIDAASNRGIDDIRSLRETIKLAPSSLRKKVYIIDEVHMLTTEAFNALLKTLEEPPSHAIFILATTEAQKIPQTILSRVQRLDFNLASPAELQKVLERIAQKENINIEKQALMELCKRADGSFRDGVKLLDQVSVLGVKITTVEVIKNLKSTDFDSLLELLEDLAHGKSSEALLWVSNKLMEGGAARDIIIALMDTLRSLVMVKNGLGEKLIQPLYSKDQYNLLVQLSQSFSNRDLIRDVDIFQNSLEKLKIASIPSLPLELAVVEICGKDEMTQSINRSDIKEEVKTSKTLEENTNIQKPDISVSQSDQKNAPSHPSVEPASADVVKLHEKWTFVLETIRPYNFSLEALLRSVQILDCSSGIVILEVPYSFHQRILETPKSKDLLESVLSDVLGKPIKVSTVLGKKPIRDEEVANVEVAADDEVLRIAAEIFNGKVVD